MKKLLVYLSLTFYVGSLFSQTPVADNGRLQVIGHKLCNEKGKPIQLKGMCLFGLMHEPQCVTFDGFKTLREKWKVDVIRAPIYVNNFSSPLNYIKSPDWNNNMIDSMMIWAEKLGVYLILDWHNDAPYGNPTDTMFKGADAFFDLMSSKYASKKNIIYELFNEPFTKDVNTPKVTWDSIVKYTNRVMPKIRKNDTNAIILVGCPDWDQKLAMIDTSMLNDNKNVMFTFHFYAASHKSLYTAFKMEIHRIPVFVSEWGTCGSDGQGVIDSYTSNLFLNTFKQDISNKDTVMLSWCNFSYGDKSETASSLKPGSCYTNMWDNTTASGDFVKYWLINNTAPAPVVPPVVVPKTYAEAFEKDSLFSIFPNPATNSISIVSSLEAKVSVSVKNMLGIDVIAPVSFEKNATINIEALPLGIYYVVFTNEGKQASLLFSKIK